MKHNRIRYATIALLALVVIVDVACAPVPNALPASNATTVPNSASAVGAVAIAAEMPLKFFLIHSVFSPGQENATAVTVTRDGEDLTFPSDSSADLLGRRIVRSRQ